MRCPNCTARVHPLATACVDCGADFNAQAYVSQSVVHTAEPGDKSALPQIIVYLVFGPAVGLIIALAQARDQAHLKDELFLVIPFAYLFGLIPTVAAALLIFLGLQRVVERLVQNAGARVAVSVLTGGVAGGIAAYGYASLLLARIGFGLDRLMTPFDWCCVMSSAVCAAAGTAPRHRE